MKWSPLFEVIAKEGDAVLFPPGWIHETLNTAEGCTVALTTQFSVPAPVGYYRSYYNRLRRVGDLNSCWGMMMSWATLGRRIAIPQTRKEALAQAEKLYGEVDGKFEAEQRDFYDINGDGEVSKEEFVDTFVAWAATERAASKETPGLVSPDMTLSAPAKAGPTSGEL